MTVSFRQVLVNKEMPAVTRGDAVDQVDQEPKKQEWRPTPLTYKGPLPSYVEKVRFFFH